MAAILGQGPTALLARSSAAWLWDVPGHSLEPIDVLHRRDQHLPAVARHHTSRSLAPADATVRRDIPVTRRCERSSTWLPSSTRSAPDGTSTT